MGKKMHLKKKNIGIFVIFSILGLSFLSSVPTVVGIGPSMESTLGHNFTEEYWSGLYDFAGDHLVADYNPGPLSGMVTTGLTDSNPGVNNIFYGAYTNIGNVQSLYLAFHNYTWGGSTDPFLYGCSPYQVLAQHFVPAGQPNYHILAINSFLGLLAYKDNKTDGKTSLPDQNDEMYMGWSYWSEYHKLVANLMFLANELPQWMYFNKTDRTTPEPIPAKQTTTANSTSYTFGMTYHNLFILWQKVSITEGLNETVTEAQILTNCSAFALLNNLTYRYIVNYTDSTDQPGLKEVTTTTEYDIGEITDLWVVGDDANNATAFDGKHFSITTPVSEDLCYYNQTSNGVGQRLNGTVDTPGFSLAVINTANIIVMNSLGGEVIKDFVDQDGGSLGASTKNITAAQLDVGTEAAYKIDFAGKPKYTLGGTTEYDAPTRVVENTAVSTQLGFLQRFLLTLLIAGFIGNITGSPFGWLTTLAKMNDVKFYYATCFPEWAGQTITQDPTFTAYVSTTSTNIPGYELILTTAIGSIGIIYVFIKIKKKKQLKIV